MTALF